MPQNHLLRPELAQLADAHTDITAPGIVEVELSPDRTVLWVNVNGICLLRMCRIDEIIITERK